MKRKNSRKSRRRTSSHKNSTIIDSTQALNVQYSVPKIPINKTYCNNKLQILEQKLNHLAATIANVSFQYGKPMDTAKATCTRYRNEARVKERYNITNIWSSIKQINNEDITFVTQMTTKRMGVLQKVAAHWSGPINVAVYARKEELSLIPKYLRENILLLNRKNIEFHVVIEDGVSNSFNNTLMFMVPITHANVFN